MGEVDSSVVMEVEVGSLVAMEEVEEAAAAEEMEEVVEEPKLMKGDVVDF